MVALITADLHLSASVVDGYRHALVARLPEIASSRRANLAIILGDLTEQKDRHSAWLVNRVVHYIDELSRVCDVIVVRGNHDYLDEDHPFFQFLRHLPNVTWVNRPLVDGNWLLLPHTHDYKADWQDLKFADHDVIFAHQTFEGARSENNRRLAGIPTNIFPSGVQVISGDIHVPQKIGPVTYVGAPYTMKFGDDYEPRLLELREGELTSIPLDRPQKRLVEVDAVSELWKLDHGLLPGDILKVRVHIGMADVARWHELRAQVREWGEDEKYQVHAVIPVMEANPGERPKVSERARKPDTTLVREYAKHRDLDPGTLEAGLSLLRSA